MEKQTAKSEYRPMGERLVIVSSSHQSIQVDVNGVVHSAFKADFRKSSDKKGIERSIESRLGANQNGMSTLIHHEVDNHFDEVYVVPRSFSTYGSRGTTAFLFVIPTLGTFLVDMYADVIINCLLGNGVSIDANCRIGSPLKLASAGNLVPISIDVKAVVKQTNENKVKKSELVVGRIYSNSKTRYIYLGKEGNKLMFITGAYGSLLDTRIRTSTLNVRGERITPNMVGGNYSKNKVINKYFGPADELKAELRIGYYGGEFNVGTSFYTKGNYYSVIILMDTLPTLYYHGDGAGDLPSECVDVIRASQTMPIFKINTTLGIID